MLKEVCVLNVSLFLTLLAILAIVSVSSQAEPFGDANFREAANYELISKFRILGV
jgi:hypothetical protein